ncbi:MAG: PorP/SprF family type IX secretion system membrane protein [Bacteroidota bacterium]
MKRQIIYLFILFNSVSYSQQYPIINQHFLNSNLYNPAGAGQSGYTQISGIFRQQWVDVQNGPQTNILTIDGPVTDRMGLGLLFVHDSENIVSNTRLMGMYSYKLPIASDHFISFGLSLGLIQNRIEFDKIVASSPFFDSGLLDNRENDITGEGSFGLLYSFKKFELSLGAQELFASRFNFQNDDGTQNIAYNLLRQFIGSLAYSYDVTGIPVNIRPKVLVRSAQGLPAVVEGNLLFTYDKNIWAGITYRQEDNWAVSLGTFVFDKFTIGYSYEMNTGDLGSNFGDSHEFLIGYRFGKRAKKNSDNIQAVPSPSPVIEDYEPRIKLQEEKIDQLTQQVDLLKEELARDEARIDFEQQEIRELQRIIADQRLETIKLIESNSVDLDDEEQEFDANAQYYVVVGSFEVLDHAKNYQRLLVRSHALQSLITQNNAKTHYLVYTLSSANKQDLLNELNKVRSIESDVIQGTPWVYKYE